jgi:uncharacterized protein (DUF488 family)
MTNISSQRIFTIGHSAHAIETFLGLLTASGIETLVDVRSFPGSRRHPQFNRDTLSASLKNANIQYLHMVTLGGRRKRQEVAEPYGEYAKTAPFRMVLTELEALAQSRAVAIMCAEALWWQCHRRIIAEELAKDGFAVTHILPPAHAAEATRSPELPGL